MDNESGDSLISIIGSTRAHIDAALSTVRSNNSAAAKRHLLLVKKHMEEALNLLG